MSGRALALAAATIVLLAACGGQSPPPEPVAASRVDLPASYKFEPEIIRIEAGTEVTWTNSDHFTHTVRLGREGGGVLGRMAPGETLTHRFEEPGTYRYDCSLHPREMQATVVVTDGG